MSDNGSKRNLFFVTAALCLVGGLLYLRLETSPVAAGERSGSMTRMVRAAGRCCQGVTWAVAALLAIPIAQAAPLPDPHRMISYSVVDQDLRDVLTGIGEQLGLRISISAQVHGRVHGRIAPASAEQTLDTLASLYGFDWYCDGRTIFISAYDEAVSKVLPLGPVSADELTQTLSELGVSDSRWPLRFARAPGVAAVNGPPRYATLVDETLTALAQTAKNGVTEVHVFRGAAATP
jgi:type II secretory pathway component GspD/PulD (secretin)